MYAISFHFLFRIPFQPIQPNQPNQLNQLNRLNQLNHRAFTHQVKHYIPHEKPYSL